jgi:hypothetical protein
MGGFYWVKEIIDKQNSNTKNNEKFKKSRSKFLKIVLNGNFIFPTVSLHNNILMKIECQFDCL